MSFVALKCISVTAYKPALFDDLWFKNFQELVFDQLRLRFSLQADQPMVRPSYRGSVMQATI
jgi:hypothetical protein